MQLQACLSLVLLLVQISDIHPHRSQHSRSRQSHHAPHSLAEAARMVELPTQMSVHVP
jgi:hypothetical protein